MLSDFFRIIHVTSKLLENRTKYKWVSVFFENHPKRGKSFKLFGTALSEDLTQLVSLTNYCVVAVLLQKLTSLLAFQMAITPSQ